MNSKRSIILVLALALGVIYGTVVEMTLDPLGDYARWMLFCGFVTLAAAYPAKTFYRFIIGMLSGILGMLVMYGIAYMQGDLGVGADVLFYAGLFSWSLFGVQFGIVAAVLASGLWFLSNLRVKVS
ncbi:hypothetical protein [Herpetosiphon geysericola]|uniref:Uncharacterized protein n=1 Tax=Herpetosiphon geysericola TaxID=70996 RepID=A0A0P6Y4R3_9CHLR|nr:hypothetical protein [Herpetosiphon geysericola]KPL91141.1 hypothetical protein SE18_03055 [Herpetosiphon geysericola]